MTAWSECRVYSKGRKQCRAGDSIESFAAYFEKGVRSDGRSAEKGDYGSGAGFSPWSDKEKREQDACGT